MKQVKFYTFFKYFIIRNYIHVISILSVFRYIFTKYLLLLFNFNFGFLNKGKNCILSNVCFYIRRISPFARTWCHALTSDYKLLSRKIIFKKCWDSVKMYFTIHCWGSLLNIQCLSLFTTFFKFVKTAILDINLLFIQSFTQTHTYLSLTLIYIKTKYITYLKPLFILFLPQSFPRHNMLWLPSYVPNVTSKF